MHETGIAVEILHGALKAATQRSGNTHACLIKVRVAVGELSAVDPDLLQHAWQAVVTDSPQADAVLDVRWCPARRHCPTCNEDKQDAVGSWLQLCPDCQGPLVVEGGRELDLETVEFETGQELEQEVQ
jgi:hydrogenase nickel incorporation protein HypA/HybF